MLLLSLLLEAGVVVVVVALVAVVAVVVAVVVVVVVAVKQCQNRVRVRLRRQSRLKMKEKKRTDDVLPMQPWALPCAQPPSFHRNLIDFFLGGSDRWPLATHVCNSSSE